MYIAGHVPTYFLFLSIKNHCPFIHQQKKHIEAEVIKKEILNLQKSEQKHVCPAISMIRHMRPST